MSNDRQVCHCCDAGLHGFASKTLKDLSHHVSSHITHITYITHITTGRYGVAVTIVEGQLECKKMKDMGDELLVDILPQPSFLPADYFSVHDVQEEEGETIRKKEKDRPKERNIEISKY